jgi:predicted ATPase/DNA-binding CsgD family transcriptional regulator
MPVVQEDILLYQSNDQDYQLTVGTDAWYAWLGSATRFSFHSKVGTFTARREQAGHKRGGWYWRAYLKRQGRLRHVYIGTEQQMTLERLRAVAVHLSAPSTEAEEELKQPPFPGILPDSGFSEPTRIPPTNGNKTPVQLQLPVATLPLPLTSFVGRENEIATLGVLLGRPEVRLLTLTGMGGVGKTRLALAMATQLQQNFANGARFIDLSSIQDAELVLPALVQALGLQTVPRPPLEVLQNALREQQRLLVLDNFEQVVSAAPDLVDLLVACPQLKLLVTSREVLRVRGEYEFLVEPLTGLGADALFLARAREVDPFLEPSDQNAALITAICRRLDGLPLALELAAAQLRALSLPMLLERLEHRLHLLTGGPRDLPYRQQTLRQTIGWSYDLLSAAEQRFFRLLAVFVGGCTLEAAEAVYSMLPGGDSTTVLNMVTSLLDKHLLTQNKPANQPPRLLMHETLREYGLAALAANHELEMARQTHAEYYLGQSEAYASIQAMLEWLKHLEREYANLHMALQWVLDHPASELARRIKQAVLRFWQNWPQHRVESNSEVEVPPGQGVRGLAQMNLTSAVRPPGQEQRAEIAVWQPDRPEKEHSGWILYLLATLTRIGGDPATARLYAEKGIDIARESDEKLLLANLYSLSGEIALDYDEDQIALTFLEESLKLHLEAGDTSGSITPLFFLPRTYAALGDFSRARAYARQLLALARLIGYQPAITVTLTFLGRLALEEGDVTMATKLFEESLAVLRETKVYIELTVAINLQGLGVTMAKLGHWKEAARLWSGAEHLCPIVLEERPFVARLIGKVRTELGEEDYRAAWAEGQAFTMEQAVATLEQFAHPDRVSPPVSTEAVPALSDLTTREKEVLRLVAQGLTDAQVASTLVISPRTVNAHLRSIYTKLQLSSRHAAIYFALKHGLI